MKKIFLIISFLFILTACGNQSDNGMAGATEREIKACELVKEFVVFESPDTENVSCVQCFLKDPTVYVPADTVWVALDPKPSAEHPNYENYLRNKEYKEQNNIETPATTLLVDPDNNIVLDPNIGGQLSILFFEKTDSSFVRVTDDSRLVELYGEDILK
ncbi:MAG TPA: membrane lipoprotein lipid attachment site-containing protein [Candidatus Bipolaricaulota bacterium]|nr:membrane lipoprotein lipid attachment site-containing protein [Candidatus Bipolaricaulota bacterium]